MRCHYDVLGVSNIATDEELKKSHRRLALQWHPDKNLDNLEEATEKFREIQNAYEVLSDPQERAFYDRNRESILYGADDGEQKGNIVNVFDYFTTSCFTGFDDSEKGFYAVYRNVFDMIVAKDLEYIDDPAEVSIPSFGTSNSNLEDVAEFYGYWQSYCTYVSFRWVFEHDIRLATNRWIEKRIEKENKKLRDKARKKYNEEVRSLVAFVRKRDQRWASFKKKLEEKVVENARKQQEYQNEQRDKRRKWVEENVEAQKESMAEYESQLQAMEAQFAAEWGFSEEEEDPIDEDFESGNEELADEGGPLSKKTQELFCIACDKTFKTDKAFLNHEQSKKHIENVSLLKKYMQNDEKIFTSQTNDDPLNSTSERSSSKKKKKRRNQMKKQEAKEQQAHSCPAAESSTDSLVNGGDDVEGPQSIDGANSQIDGSAIQQESVDLSSDAGSADETKKSKKKAKKSKKKNQTADSAASAKTTNEPICTKCGIEFSSKNKLFAHLKETGHAAFKESSKSTKKSKR